MELYILKVVVALPVVNSALSYTCTSVLASSWPSGGLESRNTIQNGSGPVSTSVKRPGLQITGARWPNFQHRRTDQSIPTWTCSGQGSSIHHLWDSTRNQKPTCTSTAALPPATEGSREPGDPPNNLSRQARWHTNRATAFPSRRNRLSFGFGLGTLPRSGHCSLNRLVFFLSLTLLPCPSTLITNTLLYDACCVSIVTETDCAHNLRRAALIFVKEKEKETGKQKGVATRNTAQDTSRPIYWPLPLPALLTHHPQPPSREKEGAEGRGKKTRKKRN